MSLHNKTCCFTGHRKIPFDQLPEIHRRLEKEIIRLIREEGVTYFGAGGALGFDTLAAQKILELKKVFPQIKLILVLPCKEQTKGWKQNDIDIYHSIKNRCDKYVYTAETYSGGCMLKRNRHLVKNSGYCICYFTGSGGGTAYTVSYAKSNGLKIINIAS